MTQPPAVRPQYEIYPYALVVSTSGPPSDSGRVPLTAVVGFVVDKAHEGRVVLREARFLSTYDGKDLSTYALASFHQISAGHAFTLEAFGHGRSGVHCAAGASLTLGPAQSEWLYVYRPTYVLELPEQQAEALRPPHLRRPLSSP